MSEREKIERLEQDERLFGISITKDGKRIDPLDFYNAGGLDVCPGCGDGDKVPPRGYWHCNVCDAEWGDDAERIKP